jgi:hypothetical protein
MSLKICSFINIAPQFHGSQGALYTEPLLNYVDFLVCMKGWKNFQTPLQDFVNVVYLILLQFLSFPAPLPLNSRGTEKREESYMRILMLVIELFRHRTSCFLDFVKYKSEATAATMDCKGTKRKTFKANQA